METAQTVVHSQGLAVSAEKRTGMWQEGRDLATDWEARLMSRNGRAFYSVTEMAWLRCRGQEENTCFTLSKGDRRLLPSEWFHYSPRDQKVRGSQGLARAISRKGAKEQEKQQTQANEVNPTPCYRNYNTQSVPEIIPQGWDWSQKTEEQRWFSSKRAK